MIDKIEIQELISIYHEGASTAEFDQLVATFLPDGTWEVPALGILCRGRDDIRSMISKVMAPIDYLVQVHAPAIIVVDGDTASARSLVRESAKFRDRSELMDVVGQYVDELERTPEGWRFARKTFTILGTHLSAAIS
jgi:hypothetical protein